MHQERTAITDITTNNNKTRIVNHDQDDPTAAAMTETSSTTTVKTPPSPGQGGYDNEAPGSNDVIYYPDGTVAFTEAGRAFWQPRLAKIGISIDTIKTRDDWGLALELSIKADTDRKSGMAELAAILTLDRVERAKLEKKAEALRVKERRATLRVVGGSAKQE